MRKKVYIIILNWNNWNDTIECLQSVFKSKYESYSVVVCDNYSENDSFARLKTWIANKLCTKDKIALLQTGANLGYAGGNNVGLKYALEKGDGDYFWILNNDTVVQETALEELVKYASIHEKTGIIGSKIMDYYAPEKIQSVGCWFNEMLGTSGNFTDINKIGEIDYIAGASLFLTKELLQGVGFLSEEYFLYYEEPDLAYRARRKQYKCGCALASIVYHKEGASIGASNRNKGKKSLIGDFHSIRSRIIFTKKFNKRYLPTVYLGLLGAMLNRLKRKQYNRITMIGHIMLRPQQDFAAFKKRIDRS
jgi:GT2 family glycosyltransferase